MVVIPITPAEQRVLSSAGERAIEVRRLVWESDFFRAPMAALLIAPRSGPVESRPASDALTAELRAALREAELDGFKHVSVRVEADDIAALWAAERAGLRLMDVAIDLKFTFEADPLPRLDEPRVRPASRADIPAMRALTAGAFGLTRFAVDPFFSAEQVDAFYAAWSTNLFSGLADAVFIAEIDGRPAGFASAKLTGDGQGRIPLLATARDHQRRGVGRGVLAAALHWFAEQRCSAAFVKTQAANYPAVALYERAGFRVHQSELTFTTTLNQE